MSRYANNTSVSSEKTKAEIERTLIRYGADQFISGWKGTQAIIGFRMKDRLLRFNLPLPDRNSEEFKYTPKYEYQRTESAQYREWEQATRQRWRALLLVIKARLEAVEIGIETFEEAFLAHIVMPDGKTVAEHSLPSIEAAYKSGKTIPLLTDF